MPAYERRLVHIALRNHPQVTTQSVGEGERRKVTIVPKQCLISSSITSVRPACTTPLLAAGLLPTSSRRRI